MRAALIVVALVVAALIPRVAAAGHHCSERSQVLGRRHCGSFGSRWSTSGLEGIEISLMNTAFLVDQFSMSPHLHVDSVVDPAGMTVPTRYAITGATGVTLEGFRSGLSWHGRWLTVALEVGGEFGGDPTVLATAGGRSIQSHPDVGALVAGLTIGLHRRFGRIEVGGELHAGGRWLAYSVELPAGTVGCAGARGPCDSTYATESTGLIVPRARVDVWVGRQLTVGVSAGHAIVGDSTMVAVMLGVHITPYDGY